MKSKTYVDDLKNKTAAESRTGTDSCQEGTFQFKIPERNKPA